MSGTDADELARDRETVRRIIEEIKLRQDEHFHSWLGVVFHAGARTAAEITEMFCDKFMSGRNFSDAEEQRDWRRRLEAKELFDAAVYSRRLELFTDANARANARHASERALLVACGRAIVVRDGVAVCEGSDPKVSP